MTQVISRVHPVHLINVEQRQGAANSQTHPTWAVSLSVGCYCLHPHRHLLLLSLKADTHFIFTIPWMVEG